MSAAIPLLPHMASWRAQNNFTFLTSEGLKDNDRTKTMLPLHSNGNADPGGRAV